MHVLWYILLQESLEKWDYIFKVGHWVVNGSSLINLLFNTSSQKGNGAMLSLAKNDSKENNERPKTVKKTTQLRDDKIHNTILLNLNIYEQ